MAAVMLVSCIGTTAFAAEVPADDMTPVLTAVPDDVELVPVGVAVVEMGQARAVGLPISEGQSAVSYNQMRVSVTVSAGATAKYVGFIISDRTAGRAATGTFTVSPALPHLTTFTASSSVQIFELGGIGLLSGQTGTWTFTVKTADITHAYQVMAVLYSAR